MRFTYFAKALITMIISVLHLVASPVLALTIEDHILYPAKAETSVLRIISTADRGAFEPIVIAFQLAHPNITIDYTIAGTSDLMKAVYDEGAVFDLAISSAMDLQTKLANDGFAQTYRSAATEAMPEWAKWRNQLFAFTQEPAVLVVSKNDFTTENVPKSRDDLIALLREDPDRFRGRVGTYDVSRSGFGYLMATQDSRNSESFWRLMEVMGRLDTQLYCCSGDMIDDITSGKLAVAYNVLGSYATTKQTTNDSFIIVELSDFVNVMLRTALIPKTAENNAAARTMIDFLTRLDQRPDVTDASGLPPINNADILANNALRPIRFGPGLLVFLDQLKRANFLRSWNSSVQQE